MVLPAAGMTLNISRMTTGTSTAVQAAENDAISNTNADDTLLTVNVRTIAGQQDISKQAIERGTGIDQFIIQDLIRGWHTTLDNQILNADGTSGSMLGLANTPGINVVTYTDASPSVEDLYPKLADAYQQVQTTVFQNPTHWIMHPRRLAFLLAAVDGSKRPLVVPTLNGPMNAVATGAGPAVYGNSGYSMMGLPIIADANIRTDLGAGTNQDQIFCVNAGELHLWEQAGSPFALNFDATGAGSLTIKSVVYGYSAFTAGRYPGATSVINGTGLIAPTF
jgi:HK97 family phage major capsid protein